MKKSNARPRYIISKVIKNGEQTKINERGSL